MKWQEREECASRLQPMDDIFWAINKRAVQISNSFIFTRTRSAMKSEKQYGFPFLKLPQHHLLVLHYKNCLQSNAWEQVQMFFSSPVCPTIQKPRRHDAYKLLIHFTGQLWSPSITIHRGIAWIFPSSSVLCCYCELHHMV